MPYSDYRPDLMGTAQLVPTGAFEAGSWQTFTLTYTAGRFGIDDTGSLKIGMRFATDFGPVQFDAPAAPGFTTVEASNGAVLELRWEFKRNIRPWSRSLYIGVKKHFLAEGDKITIRFGDQRQGSKGVRLQTYCEHAFEFRVFVDAVATYDYVPVETSPTIAIVPGPPVHWRAVLPTLIRPSQPFRLGLKADDAWGNPSDQIDGFVRLEANCTIDRLPATLRMTPGEFARVLEGLSVREPGSAVIVIVKDSDGRELCRSNPMVVEASRHRLHYWGDLHGQSNETLGTNTAEDYFLFGRDRSFLDVCSHQGNDFQISGNFWRDLNRLTAELDEPGRFVTLPGYEWSSNTAVGGDRNVFYRHEGRPIYRSSHAQIPDLSDEDNDAHDAHGLFAKLKHEDCVVWSHCGGRYADITYAHDEILETAVEVHSAWGTFEWLLHDAFAKGYRVGIVCNSDGHKGRVGASYPGASFFGAYGGLTCYLAPELSRDAIFEAMRRRHHYGTTGERLYLDVRATLDQPADLFERNPDHSDAQPIAASQLIMGDIARIDGRELALDVVVHAASPVERIELFDGPELIDTCFGYAPEDLGKRIRIIYEGAEYRGRARTTNWDGTLVLEGNQIARAEIINNWNLDRGIIEQSENSLTWKAVTTGNFGAIDLWLTEASSGSLEIKTPHISTKLDISKIGFDTQRLEAGGLARALTITRLPDQMTRTHIAHQFQVRLHKLGDTRPLVRITLEDGTRAWSSPMYLWRR